jgi:hypothetical protein
MRNRMCDFIRNFDRKNVYSHRTYSVCCHVVAMLIWENLQFMPKKNWKVFDSSWIDYKQKCTSNIVAPEHKARMNIMNMTSYYSRLAYIIEVYCLLKSFSEVFSTILLMQFD